MKDLGFSGKVRSRDGRGPFRKLVFYGISLLLSLLVIVTSTSVYFVLSFMEGSMNWYLFYLYLAILTCNMLVAGVSLAGALRSYMALEKTGSHVIFAGDVSPGLIDRTRTENGISNLTGLESEIVDALIKSHGRALQSQLVHSLGTSKATLSRALTALENKGMVVRIRKGVTNQIILDSEIPQK